MKYFTISGYKLKRNAVTQKLETVQFNKKIWADNRKEAIKTFLFENPGSYVSGVRASRYSKKRGKYV